MKTRRVITVLLYALMMGSGIRANILTDMFLNWDPNWPQRFGMTGIGYGQKQDYVVGNSEIMLGQLSIPASAIGKIENTATQFGVKADLWVLPFWNIHGILGTVDGTTIVNPAVPLFDPIEVNYDGVVYGVGSTLGYGQDWWFASVTGVITETELDSGMASVKSWLVTPKIGVRGEKFEMWIGATFQHVDEQQSGVFNVPNLGMAIYDIELEAAELWNGQLGVRYAVTDSIFVTVEGGFGNRESILGHVEFRFW
jgi:hypothetical protein